MHTVLDPHVARTRDLCSAGNSYSVLPLFSAAGGYVARIWLVLECSRSQDGSAVGCLAKSKEARQRAAREASGKSTSLAACHSDERQSKPTITRALSIYPIGPTSKKPGSVQRTADVGAGRYQRGMLESASRKAPWTADVKVSLPE